MLVKLYELGDDWQFIAEQKSRGITIRKPIGPEKHLVVQWVADNFGSAWAGEIGVAFANRPLTCFMAVKNDTIVGFACYDATALGFFGPVGVDRLHRQKGGGSPSPGFRPKPGKHRRNLPPHDFQPSLYRTWVRKVKSDR